MLFRSQAALEQHSGGHGGGGHGGSAHGGGGHGPSVHGGYGYGDYGHHGYDYGHHGYSSFSVGFGYYSPYTLGGAPYGWYGGYPSSYRYSYGVPVYVEAPVSRYQAFYPTPEQPSVRSTSILSVPSTSILLNVRVPDANAEVWFDSTKTALLGTERVFASPDLTPGKDYEYTLRARWMENGQPKDQTRKLLVHAGERVNVDFTQAVEKIPAPKAVSPVPSKD